MTVQDIRTMSDQDMDQKILEIKKTLLDFRIKQATRQSFKPHLIKRYKKQLAQIMTIKHERNIHSNVM